MEYSNPKIPEEINYSKENPLKEFIVLGVGVFLVLGAFVVVVHLLAQNFAHLIPFRYEKNLFPATAWILQDDSNVEVINREKQDYLQELTEKLANQVGIPAEIDLHVNYIDNEVINGGATLDGNILIFQGLLDAVKSENELAFVLAHEIAHIKQRHPIKSLSSGLLISIALSIITGSVDSSVSGALVSVSMLTSLKFSRTQESHADEIALHALHAYYGHVHGSHDFFMHMKAMEILPDLLKFTNTHPGTDKRIAHIQTLLQQRHYDNAHTNPLKELPPFLIQ